MAVSEKVFIFAAEQNKKRAYDYSPNDTKDCDVFQDGEETPESDVDILFVPDMSAKFSLLTLGGMYMDLKELLGREVDLVPEGSLLPFAQKTADQDKKLIYERVA